MPDTDNNHNIQIYKLNLSQVMIFCGKMSYLWMESCLALMVFTMCLTLHSSDGDIQYPSISNLLNTSTSTSRVQ